MTKQLLTALLIAGLSATAKAEPVVYQCETISFARITEKGVGNLKSHPFRLFVDLGKPESTNKKIKVVGEVITEFEVTADVDSLIIPLDEDHGENAFIGQLGPFVTFSFRYGLFSASFLSQVGDRHRPIIDSYISRCDQPERSPAGGVKNRDSSNPKALKAIETQFEKLFFHKHKD